MSADLWTDAARMFGCGLIVVSVAAPVGLVAWLVARRLGTPVLPRPHPWRVPWTGFEVLIAVLVLYAAVPLILYDLLTQTGFYQQVYGPDVSAVTPAPLEALAAVAGAPVATAKQEQQAILTSVRGLWVGVLALPVQLAVVILARYAVYPHWRSPADARAVPARVALGVGSAMILTPPVLALHAAVNLLFATLDIPREDHPLSKLSAARPVLDQGLFFLQAGVAAPVVEEILFRGVLLAWLIGGQSFLDPLLGEMVAGRRHAHDRRVLIVLVIGVAAAAALGGTGAILFAAGLLAGWGVVRAVWRRKRRTVGAVYASAALFAVVHSGVWPTPIPLFALGLGLGWLAVLTRGVLAPAVVHGLFNAVSVLFVLRAG